MTSVRPPKTQYEYYVIIPHCSEPCFLLLSTPSGWTLPRVSADAHHLGAVGHINNAVAAQLGLNATTLRCLYDNYDSRARLVTRVYALDNHSPDWHPPVGGVWLTRAALSTIQFAVPQQYAIVGAWFAWLREDSALRVAWARTGWLTQAAAWIHNQLKRHGLEAAGPIEQVRAWVRSCTLRIPTQNDTLYFKAVPRMFAYEPVLTRVLHQLYPQQMPEVLAVDVDRAWMLMRGFTGQPLNEVQDIRAWEQALHSFAQIQVDMAARVGSLIAIGCPTRHVDQLVAQLDGLLEDKNALFSGMNIDLSDNEIAELTALAPELQRMGYALLEYNIPLSLEHGDLWENNIILNESNTLFFDWSDSSVTHPFFDMLFFLSESDKIDPHIGSKEARERLLRAYLQPWTVFEPEERLMKAMSLALPLSALHRALVYHRVILPSVEARAQWEMENMLPFYLRFLLRLLKK